MTTPSDSAPAGKWVVTSPSAYRASHECVLGMGTTREAALEDAFGPRSGWGNSTRASIRRATVALREDWESLTEY